MVVEIGTATTWLNPIVRHCL